MTSRSLVMTALITPMTKEGDIDIEGFKKLVQHQLASGLTNLLLLGSTGEALLLDDEERHLLIETAMQIPGVNWWLGCMETSQKKAEEWMRQTCELPIKGYVVLAPYYIKPSQGDIEHYFRHLLNFSSHPCILYNNPSRCAVNVSEEVFSKLINHPRFIGIKECDLTPLRIHRLRQKLQPSHFLLAGDDSQLPSALCSGANGIISVLSNALPKLALDTVEGFFQKKDVSNWSKDASLWLKGCLMIDSLGNPKGIKSLMYLILDLEPCLKAPLRNLETQDLALLSHQLSLFLQKKTV